MKFYKINQTTLNTKLKWIFSFLMLICFKTIEAQIQTRAGLLPSINYNTKLNENWDANLKYESRHFLYNSNNTPDDSFKYDYSLSDISALVGKKVGLNSKLIFGALVRIEPDETSYRTIQQFITKGNVLNFRAAHRIATDQSFSNEPIEYRLRYRLSTEIPLSGLKADVKEWYFKLNTETINSIQDNVYNLEFRLVPHIGYVLSKKNKIELGFDNRLDSFIHNETRFTSWFIVNLFL